MTDKVAVATKKAQQAIGDNEPKRAVILLRKINDNRALRTAHSLLFETLGNLSLKKFDRCLLLLKHVDESKLQSDDKQLYWSLYGYTYVGLNRVLNAIESVEQTIKLDASLKNQDRMYWLCQLYASVNNHRQLKPLAQKLLATEKYYLPAQLLLLNSAYVVSDKDTVASIIATLKGYLPKLDEKSLHSLVEMQLGMYMYKDATHLLNSIAEFKGELPWIRLSRHQIAFFSKAKKHKKIQSQLNDDFIEELPNWLGRATAYKLRADLSLESEQYAAAFSDYQKMNDSITGELHADFDMVARYKNVLLPSNHLGEFESVKNTPAFMFGFPRSGTTLLDIMLNNIEGVEVLSEVAAIGFAEQRLFDLKGLKNKSLFDLSESQIKQLREDYFGFIKNLDLGIEPESDNRLLIEKMPYYTTSIPMIKTLFPNAKLIFSVRHPLDVILSCFQQNFKVSRESLHFLSLAKTVKRYSDVMSLFFEYEKHYDLNIHFVRYEELVSDPENEFNKVVNFLGLDASLETPPEMSMNIDNKIVQSASQHQVNQPIYTTARYRWRNFEAELTPFLPTLEPYIDRFGYKL